MDLLGVHEVYEEENETVATPVISTSSSIAHDLTKKSRSSDVTVFGSDKSVTFEGLNVSDHILKALKDCGFQNPSPIQLRGIPLGKIGFDLLLQAKSGTGKTCVFSVISLENIDISVKCIQALVVCPSREIAFQSGNVIKALGKFMEGLKVKIFIGGTPVEDDPRRVLKCHVAVGTPGRLVHLIKDFNMDLTQLKVFVLDEADKLLDQSFFPDLQTLFLASSKTKQVIVASATYPDNLDDFILTFMRNPVKVQLNSSCPVLVAVKQLAIDVRKVTQFKPNPRTSNEDELFKCKLQCLKKVLRLVQYSQTIIFCSHQFKAEKVYENLRASLIDAVLLSGALDQCNRLESLLRLQQGSTRLMVATDLASRGIDCENLDLVINFDCPSELATYVHRVGRAGRFGTPGIAITFLSFAKEFEILESFQNQLNLEVIAIENLESLAFAKEENKERRVGKHEGSCVESTRIFNYVKSLNLNEIPFSLKLFQGISLEMTEEEVLNYKKQYSLNFDDDD